MKAWGAGGLEGAGGCVRGGGLGVQGGRPGVQKDGGPSRGNEGPGAPLGVQGGWGSGEAEGGEGGSGGCPEGPWARVWGCREDGTGWGITPKAWGHLGYCGGAEGLGRAPPPEKCSCILLLLPVGLFWFFWVFLIVGFLERVHTWLAPAHGHRAWVSVCAVHLLRMSWVEKATRRLRHLRVCRGPRRLLLRGRGADPRAHSSGMGSHCVTALRHLCRGILHWPRGAGGLSLSTEDP